MKKTLIKLMVVVLTVMLNSCINKHLENIENSKNVKKIICEQRNNFEFNTPEMFKVYYRANIDYFERYAKLLFDSICLSNEKPIYLFDSIHIICARNSSTNEIYTYVWNKSFSKGFYSKDYDTIQTFTYEFMPQLVNSINEGKEYYKNKSYRESSIQDANYILYSEVVFNNNDVIVSTFTFYQFDIYAPYFFEKEDSLNNFKSRIIYYEK